MPRYANPFAAGGPYPTDPTFGMAAQGIARALFGDPAARQELQQHEAEMALRAAQAGASRAQGSLYGAQARGETIRNDALSGLPATFADFYSVPSSAPASGSPSPGAGGDSGAIIAPPGLEDVAAVVAEANGVPVEGPPAAVPGLTIEQARAGLPGLIAAMVQAGEAGNVDDIVNVFTAIGGGDELARRGMVGTGTTPGADFALTPERADDIRQQGFDNKIDIENIQSGDRRYHTDVSSQTSRANNTDDNSAAFRRHVTPSGDTVYNVKEGARVTNVAGANVIASALGAGVTITSNARSDAENRAVDGAARSHHLERNGANGFDIRKVPGMSSADARRRISEEAVRRGGYLAEFIDEGDHWHAAILGVKDGSKPGGSSGSPEKVGKGETEMIAASIDRKLEEGGHNDLRPGVRDGLVARAITEYQKTGNMAAAVEAAFQGAMRNMRARTGKGGTRRVKFDAKGNRVS